MESSAHNKIDNSISGGELDDNERVVLAVDGPLNKSGILGSYFFTVSPTAPNGTYQNSLHAVFFYDTDSVAYKLSSSNLQITNNQFEITPEPATLALIGLGSGLIGLSRRSRRRAEEKKAK